MPRVFQGRPVCCYFIFSLSQLQQWTSQPRVPKHSHFSGCFSLAFPKGRMERAGEEAVGLVARCQAGHPGFVPSKTHIRLIFIALHPGQTIQPPPTWGCCLHRRRDTSLPSAGHSSTG